MYIEKQEFREDDVGLREKLEKYLFQWKWILLSIIFSIVLGYTYLKFQPFQFGVSTTIFIDDKDKGGLGSELSAFEDIGVIGGGKTSIINEVGVLKSKSLILAVLKELNFNFTYFRKGKFIDEELVSSQLPFNFNLTNPIDSIIHELDTTIIITVKSKSIFLLSNQEGLTVEKEFGTIIDSNFGKFKIIPNNRTGKNIGVEIIIKIQPVRAVANNYNKRIKVETLDKKSSLLSISLIDQSKLKAIEILNRLVYRYNQDAIDYKDLLASNTDQFINSRIADISIELSDVDKGVEDYKQSNRLTDMAVEQGLILQSNAEVEKKIVKITSQIKLTDYISDYINLNTTDLIPTNLGLEDGKTSQSTELYNRLLIERNRIIKSSSIINPTVVNIDDQLNSLRENIKQSLTTLRSSLNFELEDARREESMLNSRRSVAPRQEREFQDIKRKQLIMETLYLYLLQKREENAIAIGIPVPNARVIDRASGENYPIAPNKKMILAMFFLVGFLIPISIIYVDTLLDSKVHNAQDVERILDVPILGEISQINKKKMEIVNDKNLSGYAESYRLLRTNLDFMFGVLDKKCKTILVTSTIPGEGKSSTIINIASVLGSIDKKVLMIEVDLRKPKIKKYLKLSSHIGLTNYLIDGDCELVDIIETKNDLGFDIIQSGSIPPNPSSLLLNKRLESLMIECQKNYDYILIDSPPVTAVTDAQLLGKFCDLVIYVVRANFVDKRLLRITRKLYENQFKNMAVVLNGTKTKNRGYKYGYEENDAKKSWFSF